MKMLYCIRHESMERAQVLFDTVKLIHEDGTPDERAAQIGFIHELPTWIPGYDLDWCDFGMGWATCPPPEDPLNEPHEDWESYARFMNAYFQEPDSDELAIINANADILLADLGA